jgi:hypothetical protein
LERDFYKVEDPVVKESAGALYGRMWGPTVERWSGSGLRWLVVR